MPPSRERKIAGKKAKACPRAEGVPTSSIVRDGRREGKELLQEWCWMGDNRSCHRDAGREGWKGCVRDERLALRSLSIMLPPPAPDASSHARSRPQPCTDGHMVGLMQRIGQLRRHAAGMVAGGRCCTDASQPMLCYTARDSTERRNSPKIGRQNLVLSWSCFCRG